ncbi:MAG: glycosyltransferase family 2 protein [Elainellaceae cyanobacterium]
MCAAKPPFISIIIPVYNGGLAFQDCLKSLSNHIPLPDEIPTEVIVVADGCTDDSDLVAEQFGAIVLRTESPGGPAQARNIGAQKAQGEILFFIDADVTIQADTISQVAQLFTEQPTLAAAIGSYDDAPGASNFLSQYKNLFHHYTHQTSNEEASTFWGACGAVRRHIFCEVGGFDESYRKPSIEDIEFGYRLRQNGHSIRLCKTLYVKHLKRWEVISLLRAEFFYRALPWTSLLLRQEQMNNDLNLNLSTRMSVVFTFGLIASALGGLIWPQGWLITGASAIILLVYNLRVYQFFQRQRGTWFMLKMIPWHWLYFAYCGLAYGVGTVQHYAQRPKKVVS